MANEVKQDRCLGENITPYRGYLIRCENLAINNSKYCKLHQEQSKWGFKKKNKDWDEFTLFFQLQWPIFISIIILLYYIGSLFFSSSEITLLEILMMELCFCLPTLIGLFFLLSPTKGTIEKLDVDRIEDKKVREKKMRDLRWASQIRNYNTTSRRRSKFNDDEGDDADDVGDWGSGLGDGMGPDEDEDDDDG